MINASLFVQFSDKQYGTECEFCNATGLKYTCFQAENVWGFLHNQPGC